MIQRCLPGLITSLMIAISMETALFAAEPAPAVRIEEIRTISWKPPLYHGWPTLARRANGELILAFSGGRGHHVCPFGRLEIMQSFDDGKSWQWPRVISDSPIDDRDAGLVETAQGTLLLSHFTSLAYVDALKKYESIPEGKPGSLDALSLSEWRAADRRTTVEQKQAELGCWLHRSTDGGLTWSPRISIPVNSPHGPISLRDGRLLYPGVALWHPDRKVGVMVSPDEGLSWNWLATIPVREGDASKNYHELHGVEAANGTLIVQIRNHNPANAGETLQSESTDGGKSWSMPHSIGVWGLPSHLLRLRDGRLLMSYGHRRAPLGVQVRISRDHGGSWSEAIELYGDGKSGDLGYPSTVEVADGSFVTAWYELLPGSPNAQLRQARWSWR